MLPNLGFNIPATKKTTIIHTQSTGKDKHLRKTHSFLLIQLEWPDSQQFPSGVAICRNRDHDKDHDPKRI